MVTYPKIETLFDRDKSTFKVMEGHYRNPSYRQIPNWLVYEKIHGTNVRVMVGPLDARKNDPPLTDTDLLEPQVWFAGRTDAAEFHPTLTQHLLETYTLEKVLHATRKAKGTQGVVMYMEGYGPKIQEGGGNYRDSVSTRLYDVLVLDINGPCPCSVSSEQPPSGWWLSPTAVEEIALDLGIKTVPYLGRWATEDIVDRVKTGMFSKVAEEEGGKSHIMEGVVARTHPLLLTRKGTRLMWKLKSSDFV